jgi:tRNA (guanine37-N1)-methyltransferase
VRIDIVTIFPEMFAPVLNESIIERGQKAGKVEIHVHDLRKYTTDKHHTVDDRPFGGGAGMVFKPDPIFACVEHIKKQLRKKKIPAKSIRTILMGPQGTTLDQTTAKRLSKIKNLILICPRYEGVDERVAEKLCDEEISIGDYVLTGGELAAMVLVDSVVRLVPGVLGDKNSLNFESFEGNLLEYPQYTRPAEFRGMKVPEILLTGDHKKIELWRRQMALRRTKERRPDLLQDKQPRSRNG